MFTISPPVSRFASLRYYADFLSLIWCTKKDLAEKACHILLERSRDEHWRMNATQNTTFFAIVCLLTSFSERHINPDHAEMLELRRLCDAMMPQFLSRFKNNRTGRNLLFKKMMCLELRFFRIHGGSTEPIYAFYAKHIADKRLV